MWILYYLRVYCLRGEVFPTTIFLLGQPLYIIWYKMCTCHRIHHQRWKRVGAGGIIAGSTDDHDYSQDRGERHSDSYRYHSHYVHIFDSIGIIKLDASQNRALAGVGKATRKNMGVVQGSLIQWKFGAEEQGVRDRSRWRRSRRPW